MTILPGIELAERVPIGSIESWPGNPRTHDLERIRASLREHGQFRPVYVQRSTRRIVMGHGTVEAAAAEGWTHVAASFLDVDDDEAQRILLVDNRTQDTAGYDDDALAVMLANLQGTEFGLLGTGYDAADLVDLLGREEPEPHDYEPPDRVYRPRDDRPPLTMPGDLWEVGPHRLACGDALSDDDVARVLQGAPVALMLADPPYGVNVDHTWRDRQVATNVAAGRDAPIVGDDALQPWGDAYRLAAATVFVVWHGALFAAEAMADLQGAGYQVMQQVVWDKGDAPILARSYYHWNHEVAWFGKARSAPRVPWHVGRDQITVWRATPPNRPMTPGSTGEERTDHPSQKPVAIYERPIRNHTRPGEVVYDPFVGSGTALVAAARMGRAGRALDVEARWVDVSLRRLLAHTEEPEVRRWRPDGTAEVMVRHEVLAAASVEEEPVPA